MNPAIAHTFALVLNALRQIVERLSHLEPERLYAKMQVSTAVGAIDVAIIALETALAMHTEETEHKTASGLERSLIEPFEPGPPARLPMSVTTYRTLDEERAAIELARSKTKDTDQ